MGNPVENAMKKMIAPIMDPINKIMMYIACTIKMIKNFYKCIIFYWLDIIKYTLLYLPILCLMGILGLSKEWAPIQVTLDKLIGWPNSIQNDCFRCKNEKGESMWDSLQKMLKDMMKDKGESHFSFLSFLIVVGLGSIILYTLWFSLRSPKSN
jgi:hypothetical protein